jgi:hypothetical protein
MNETLISLGIPPLVVNATPISVVFAQEVPGEGAPDIPIHILSDNEESPSVQPVPDQNAASNMASEETVPQDSDQAPLQEVNPSFAMVLYSGLVNSQPAIQLFTHLKPL